MAFCPRRFPLSYYFCFLLLFLLVAYFVLFSSLPKANYTKLQLYSHQPHHHHHHQRHQQRKLVLDQIKVAVTNDNPCSGREPPFLVQLVTSHAGNYQLRHNTRLQFNSSVLEKLRVRRLFLIGQTWSNLDQNWSPKGGQQEGRHEGHQGEVAVATRQKISNNGKFRIPEMFDLLEEQNLWNDLLIGSFVEAYRNLSYKHLMGLLWVRDHCSRAEFLLKQDDDIFVDLYALVNKLRNTKVGKALHSERGVIYGKVVQNRDVIRHTGSKWFVTKDEFQSDTYPSFVSGWAYVTTPGTVNKILQVAQNFNFFWIDDVFITGILRTAAEIDLIDGSESYAVTRDFFQCCKMVTTKELRAKSSHWCDFLFGPLPPEPLLFQLINQSERCYNTGGCLERTLENSLLKTCVITKEIEIPGRRQQTVLKKGKPLWESIKLNQ